MINKQNHHVAKFLTMIVSIASISGGPATKPSAVSVTMKPGNVQQRQFDPDNPPGGLPLDPTIEAACAVAIYSCHCETGFHVTEEKPVDAGIRMVAQVKAIRITLCLDETLWLPDPASEKLLAHEKGHAKISEKFFNAARAPVEAVATQLIDQEVSVEAKDHQAALNAAAQQVSEKIAKLYKLKTTTASLPVQQAYDQLTDHSRNKIPVEKAIPMALKHAIEPLDPENSK